MLVQAALCALPCVTYVMNPPMLSIWASWWLPSAPVLEVPSASLHLSIHEEAVCLCCTLSSRCPCAVGALLR